VSEIENITKITFLPKIFVIKHVSMMNQIFVSEISCGAFIISDDVENQVCCDRYLKIHFRLIYICSCYVVFMKVLIIVCFYFIFNKYFNHNSWLYCTYLWFIEQSSCL